MCKIYAGRRVYEKKNKILFDQTKFCTRIHNVKLGNENKYQPGVVKGYIYVICAGW